LQLNAARMTARVLVIDDEPMIRWSIAQTLQAAGHEVTVCETAAEGMALYRLLHPEVVLVDLRLPDANGATIVQTIHGENSRKTAVIVMTAFEEDCSAEAAKRLGADDYIRKPFDFDGLEALVHRALQAIGS
jgi:two-component system response regulator AtoC